MIHNKIDLTRSEINTIIAGMLLCNVRYSMGSKGEAEKYRIIEYKLRDLFYNGEEVSEGTICKKDSYDALLSALKDAYANIIEIKSNAAGKVIKDSPVLNRIKEAIKKAE